MDIIYNWDAELKQAQCIISEKNIIGIGKAVCHPIDEDVISERTGSYIAESRAKIHFLQNKKECEYKPALNTLKHLYSTMVHSKHFNPTSYEAKRIKKEIKNINNQIIKINCTIENIKLDLREYINTKDKMYGMYRIKNKIKENNNDL